MTFRTLIPVLLIATFASLPALDREHTLVTTHTEQITSDSDMPKLQVSALESGLPQHWCGAPSGTDQTVNANNNTGQKFKFYYVRASDQPDRFSAVADKIQWSISTIHSYLLESSAGTRTVALDLGTTCGTLFADITAITLPGNLSDYLNLASEIDINDTIDLLGQYSSLIGGPPRHHVFILDQFDPPDAIEGAGEMYLDDRPDAVNANNSAGMVSYVALPAGDVNQAVMDHLPRAMLHEMTHTIGGVQESAPNSTSAGHCIDGKDIMCYDDGSPEGAFFSESVCTPAPIQGVDLAYDCNKDDYFNIAPAGGSYLATKWNVANSKYLIKCEAADPYCTSNPTSDPDNDGKDPSRPTPDNPAARTATNDLYLYKRGKRGKKIGTVAATGAKQVGTAFVRNSVKMSKLKLPKGKWKLTVCFRETSRKALCDTSTRKTTSAGYLSVPRIYATTDNRSASAWGTVSVKPLSKSLKKKRYEVRTSKKLIKYSLTFE